MHVNITFFKYWYQWHLALCTAKHRERRLDLLKTQAVLFHSKLNFSPAQSQITLLDHCLFLSQKVAFLGVLGVLLFEVLFCFCGYRQTIRRIYLQKVSSTRREVSSITTSLLPYYFNFLYSEKQNFCHISCNTLGWKLSPVLLSSLPEVNSPWSDYPALGGVYE